MMYDRMLSKDASTELYITLLRCKLYTGKNYSFILDHLEAMDIFTAHRFFYLHLYYLLERRRDISDRIRKGESRGGLSHMAISGSKLQFWRCMIVE